jgi:hypothetical protein
MPGPDRSASKWHMPNRGCILLIVADPVLMTGRAPGQRYCGVGHGMAYSQAFRSCDKVRLAQSPSNGPAGETSTR